MYDYDSYSDSSPSKGKKYLYFLYYALYIAVMPFSMLGLIKYYRKIIGFLFRLKENEFVFSSTGSILFGLFGFIICIPVYAFILKFIFTLLFDMESTFKYYKKESKKNWNNRRGLYNYSFGSYKRDLIASVIIIIIAAILFLFTIFYNIRVTDEGIYHKNFFSFHTEKIEYSDINKLEFNLEIKSHKKEKPDAIPHFNVCYGENKLDIWNGFGMGSPSPEEIIKFTQSIKSKNPDIIIDTSFNLDTLTKSYLQKYTNGQQIVEKVYYFLEN